MKHKSELTRNQIFNRLRRSYLIALSLVALTFLLEFVLVEQFLEDQRGDAEIINVAGRQRMLSQRIAKSFMGPGGRSRDTDRKQWTDSHDWLKNNIRELSVAADLENLDPLIDSVLQLSVPTADTALVPSIQLARLDAAADRFLVAMDAIVNRLSAQATAKVGRLRTLKKWLTGLALLIVGLELLFIFRPITRFIADQFVGLREEREAQLLARREAEEAAARANANLLELLSLNHAIDQAALFATVDRQGRIIYLSKRFRQLLSTGDKPEGLLLTELVHEDEVRQDQFSRLLTDARAAAWTGEWVMVRSGEEDRHLLVSLIPARHNTGRTELFVFATDQTSFHAARRQLDELNQEKIAEERRVSSLQTERINTAQERERLRVAHDLHDGIGQQLTALKFGLESLRPQSDCSPEAAAHQEKRIAQLRELSQDIIRGVRIATFNLTPPEIGDYGLAPTLEKMTRELGRMTGENIVFRNEAPDLSLPEPTALAIYRIAQEAVNNAIKYAAADYILITLAVSKSFVSVTVDDDGVGFDPGEIQEEVADGTGQGLTSMRTRTSNLGGRLFLRSDPETGTRVTINVPLP